MSVFAAQQQKISFAGMAAIRNISAPFAATQPV